MTGDRAQDDAILEQCRESGFLMPTPEELWLHAMDSETSSDGGGAVVSPGLLDRDLGGTAIDSRPSLFDGLF